MKLEIASGEFHFDTSMTTALRVVTGDSPDVVDDPVCGLDEGAMVRLLVEDSGSGETAVSVSLVCDSQREWLTSEFCVTFWQ